MDNIISLNSLSIGYQDVIVKDINICVQKKSLCAVLCPNSCGKSTLIKTLSGLILPISGNIIIDGITYSKNKFKNCMLKFGTVFEDDVFLSEKVIDELYFPVIHLGYSKRKMRIRVNDIATVLGISDILYKKIDDISLYEKTLLKIGVAMMHYPKILFIDDVFKYLNSKDKKKLLDIFNLIIQKYDMSILFTTSSIEDVINLSYIYVIGDSEVKFSGSYESIIKDDNELVKLGFEVPLMIDLSRKLEFYNLVDTIYYEPDEVIDKLWN